MRQMQIKKFGKRIFNFSKYEKNAFKNNFFFFIKKLKKKKKETKVKFLLFKIK